MFTDIFVVYIISGTGSTVRYMNETDHSAFDKDFCSFLEYHLCETFKNNGLKYFWCDGIDHQATHVLKKDVTGKGKIITKAWLGSDGQNVYEMTLTFGALALRRYTLNQNLQDCVPSSGSMDWISLDIESRTIEVLLT